MGRENKQLSSAEMLTGISCQTGDDYSLPSSELTFNDRSSFGIELSSINNLNILQKTLIMAEREGVTINRVDECRGVFRLPGTELSEMIKLCEESNVDLVLSIGPRAIYDTGGFVKTKNGSRIGYRLRGMDNIRFALDDIVRGIELGARHFLIYDEGLLFLLNKLRKKEEIPAESTFKVSVHCACSNPASASLYESIGAESINLVPDLELPMLSSIRHAVSCPLDVFSDTASDAGGFIQTSRVPEIIRLCAPVYLKCGPVSQVYQNHLPSDVELSERIKQLVCVMETINRVSPHLNQLSNA